MGFAWFGRNPDCVPYHTPQRNADTDAVSYGHTVNNADTVNDANHYADPADDADADSAAGSGTDDDPAVWHGTRIYRSRRSPKIWQEKQR